MTDTADEELDPPSGEIGKTRSSVRTDDKRKVPSTFAGKVKITLWKLFHYEANWATVKNGFTSAVTLLIVAAAFGVFIFFLWLGSKVAQWQ